MYIYNIKFVVACFLAYYMIFSVSLPHFYCINKGEFPIKGEILHLRERCHVSPEKKLRESFSRERYKGDVLIKGENKGELRPKHLVDFIKYFCKKLFKNVRCTTENVS